MKIGQTVTKEQFIKYAPHGLILKSSSNTFFYFNKNTTVYSEHPSIPGYVFGHKHNETFVDEEHIMGLWSVINLYPVYRLPKKLLKRRQHV